WMLLGLKDKGELERVADDEWTADLSKVEWKRGDFTIRVELQTEDPDPQKVFRDLLLRFQPPRPSVVGIGEHPLVVKEAAYPIKARVEPGIGQAVVVQLFHRPLGDKDKETVVELGTVEKPLEIDRKVELKPGRNLIRIVAHNKGSKDELEKHTLTLDVQYKTPAPQFGPMKLVLPDGEEVVLDPAKASEAVKVGAATVRIVGTVEALAELTKLEWEAGGKSQSLKLEKGKKKA